MIAKPTTPRRFATLRVSSLALLASVTCARTGTPPGAPVQASGPHNGPPTNGEIRLLIRGDDMGAAHGVNLGHIQSFQQGIMRSTEVIVPAPWMPEAVALLEKNPNLDVGIHLALTSEWTNIKWRPLTQAPSIVDADGFFFPMVQPNADYPKDRALAGASFKIEEVEAELRAQIEMLKRKVPRLSHGGCHMGCGGAAPEIRAVIAKLLAEYGLARDTSHLKQIPIPWPKVKADRKALNGEQRADLFAATLETLEPGDYLFIEHPATDDPEMRAVHHIGYENVASDRAGVLVMWTSEKVKEVIRRRNIKLISYLDLPAKGS